MAVTQYIGSRYVPLFADPIEWSSANTYEPLTIVIHEGNSYTSRQAVPKGIDIDNEAFWALTGNYNAQVELHRRETAAARAAAGAAQNDIDTLLPKSAFSEANTVKKYVDDSAAAVRALAMAAQADIDTLLPKADFSAENTVKKYIDLNKTRVLSFDTVADMQTANDLVAGMTCHTNGFHASGDNGAAYYAVSASGTANGMDVLACAGGLFATLVFTEPYVTPEQFGAWGDGTHDDTAYIQAAFNSGKSIVFNNSYNCGSVDVNSINDAVYKGNNCMFTGDVDLKFSNCKHLIFDSLRFEACTHAYYAIRFIDCVDMTVSKCNFAEMPYTAITIVRTAIDAISKHYVFDGCTFINVNTSETYGGAIYWDGLGPDENDSLEAKPISAVIVSNCYFENVGCVGVNSGGCVDLTVCNNICKQDNAAYTETMGLMVASRESAKIVANDNIILHTKYEGLIFHRAHDIIVNGNYFFDCLNCVVCERESSNAIISSNKMIGGFNTGSLNVSRTNCNAVVVSNSTDVLISSNTIDDCNIGVYLAAGCENVTVQNCEIHSNGSCMTGVQPTSAIQIKNIKVANNDMISETGSCIAILLHSGQYVIKNNTIETKANTYAMYVPYFVVSEESQAIITGNWVKTSGSALHFNLNDNQTDGHVRYVITDNDFSNCATAISKSAEARVVALSFARNRKMLSAVELFSFFDGHSEMEYDGTLAALMAETPGSQNMKYVRWQIGSVVKCNDTFIHVTRAGNAGLGATLQYKEW